MRRLVLLLSCSLALAAGCGGGSSSSPAAPSQPAAPVEPVAAAPAAGGHGAWKPGAPIDLALTATPIAGADGMERYELTLRATPRRDVTQVELSLDGGRPRTAGVAAGIASEVKATVEIAPGAGRDVIATATVIVDGLRMGAATQVRIGAPAATTPGQRLQLPDGTVVEEVRQ